MSKIQRFRLEAQQNLSLYDESMSLGIRTGIQEIRHSVEDAPGIGWDHLASLLQPKADNCWNQITEALAGRICEKKNPGLDDLRLLIQLAKTNLDAAAVAGVEKVGERVIAQAASPDELTQVVSELCNLIKIGEKIQSVSVDRLYGFYCEGKVDSHRCIDLTGRWDHALSLCLDGTMRKFINRTVQSVSRSKH
jgi:hypothetical protein